MDSENSLGDVWLNRQKPEFVQNAIADTRLKRGAFLFEKRK